MMVTVTHRYMYNCYMWLRDCHPSGDTEYRKATMILSFDELKINIHNNVINYKDLNLCMLLFLCFELIIKVLQH